MKDSKIGEFDHLSPLNFINNKYPQVSTISFVLLNVKGKNKFGFKRQKLPEFFFDSDLIKKN